MTRKRWFAIIAAVLFLLTALWILSDQKIDALLQEFLMKKSYGKYITYGTNYSGLHPDQIPSTLRLGDLLFALPYLMCAVLFFIKGFVAKDKLPTWLFFVAFGLFIVTPFIFECEHILWDIQMNAGISMYGGVILAFTAIFFVAFKKKTKKVFFIPCIWSILYMVILLAELNARKQHPYLSRRPIFPAEAWMIFFSILVQGAAFFFMLWVLIKEQAPAAQAKQVEESVAQAETEDMEDEASTESTQPQLTDEQKEELANLKEYYELGAYTDEEYEAEKQRIIYRL